MAVLWQQYADGKHYEVRSAGRTRRLYTNGVVHTELNLARPVTGSVWDLMLIPAYFYPSQCLRRVLVLGVGGGAVIRQLLELVAPGEIVGVDSNAVHLHVARRFFGIDDRRVHLHEADAVEWIQGYSGASFDLIIDDLFDDADREPRRAVPVTAQWLRGLLRHLSADGAVVCNFVSAEELRSSAYFRNRALASRFRCAFALTHPRVDNAVGVFLRADASSASLRRRLKAVPALDPTRKTNRLEYRIRRLSGR